MFKLIIDFTECTADLRKEDHPHISKLRYYWSTLSQPPNREREHREAAFEIQQTLHINSDAKAGRR